MAHEHQSRHCRAVRLTIGCGLMAAWCASTPLGAQRSVNVEPVQIDATRPDWENPTINARNRMSARATFFAYDNREEALAADRSSSRRFLSLDGPWAFSFSPNSNDIPRGFEQPDYDVSTWKAIPVPSMWQAQGYDQPRYNNITYPFPANRPLIPHDINTVGSYRRTVDVPPEWSGQDVVLHIGAAGAGYYVWVNGSQVGYAEDSKLPSEFDVTRHLKRHDTII